MYRRRKIGKHALVGGVGEGTTSNLDDMGLGESDTNGQESGGNSGETHLELDRERGSKERA